MSQPESIPEDREQSFECGQIYDSVEKMGKAICRGSITFDRETKQWGCNLCGWISDPAMITKIGG